MKSIVKLGLILITILAGLTACLSDGLDHGDGGPDPWSGSPANLPDSRTEVAATVYQDELLLGGGVLSGGGEARPVYAYDPEADSWRHLTDLPRPGHHLGMAALDGRLYVVGGYPGSLMHAHAETDDLWIYDFATAEWTAGPAMPTARGALAVVAFQGRIHAIGGTVDRAGASVATHEAFDPLTGEWETLAPMNRARDHLGAAVIGDRIYAAAGRTGGLSDLTVLEAYDPEADAWTRLASMPTGRSGVGVAVLKGKMYVIGGETFGDQRVATYRTVERYDPETDAWDQVPSMPTARHGLGAGAVGGSIYAVSGGPVVGWTFSAINERYTPLP
jgi:hypothetical protein